MTGHDPLAPGSRLTRKGQATRDRIVAAASGLVYERGVAGTSTDDVQAAAGVSTSQIYHYFRDKKALVRAVIAHQTDAVLEGQQPLLSRLDTLDGLREWRNFVVDLQHRHHCAGGCPIGSLGSELAEADDEARADVAAGFERWAGAIRAGLHAMRDRGDLSRDADPDRLGLAILTTLQGGLLLTQIRRDTVALETGLDAMLDHVASFMPLRDRVDEASIAR
jgi:TetR/AcrR family transcriptional regulator, transcriptional repressor for nem operon